MEERFLNKQNNREVDAEHPKYGVAGAAIPKMTE